MSKPLILITNDDGIDAPGIRTLINAMKDLGTILVVAPDKPQSGMGHAITTTLPLRARRVIDEADITEYSLNGTPVDCIKFSDYLLNRVKPDLLVSGINHGSNASINVIYSGTMAAVLEGAINGIPSIGFSVTEFSHHVDLSFTVNYIRNIVKNVLENGLPPHVALNVNIPYSADKPLNGIKVCRQAKAFWRETFEEKKDPHGRPYYWLTGDFNLTDTGTDSDQWALDNNYVAVVPVQVDFTSYDTISLINKWDFHV